VHEEDDQTTTLSAQRSDTQSTVRVSRAPNGLVVRVFTDARTVTGVAGFTAHASRAAFDAAESGWYADGRYTWVRVAPTTAAVELQLAH
jgi:hypothetical protein